VTAIDADIDLRLLDHWLDEWAYSMRAHREVEGVVVNDSPWRNAMRAVNEDYDFAVEDARMAGIVEAMDACIDSLLPHQRWAVYFAYEQITIFPFPRLDHAIVLAQAKVELGLSMRARGYPC
jgi:hypothetical protein